MQAADPPANSREELYFDYPRIEFEHKAPIISIDIQRTDKGMNNADIQMLASIDMSGLIYIRSIKHDSSNQVIINKIQIPAEITMNIQTLSSQGRLPNIRLIFNADRRQQYKDIQNKDKKLDLYLLCETPDGEYSANAWTKVDTTPQIQQLDFENKLDTYKCGIYSTPMVLRTLLSTNFDQVIAL